MLATYIAEETEKQEEMPWLTFRLMNQIYAVFCKRVSSIQMLTEHPIQVPEYPEYVRGVLNIRGVVTPMVDLRRFFQMPSIDSEYREVADMLEQRQEDHVHWMNELERSIKQNTPFKLATDPHKCAFGKWYDAFMEDDTNEEAQVHLRFHLRKISDPHKALHDTAGQVLKCNQDCDHCGRNECLKTALDKARQQYVPQVLELLDQAKEIFRAGFREMCIVLQEGDRGIGLIVDEVLSVEELEQLGEEEDSFSLPNQLISGMAKSASLSQRILLLDDDSLFGTVAQ